MIHDVSFWLKHSYTRDDRIESKEYEEGYIDGWGNQPEKSEHPDYKEGYFSGCNDKWVVDVMTNQWMETK